MEDKRFKDLLQESKLEIQFPDFEEKVMEQIKLKEESRKSVWRNLKISWLFFILGAFLGIIASGYLANIKFSFIDNYNSLIILFIEIFVVIIIITQFDNLYHFTFRKKRN